MSFGLTGESSRALAACVTFRDCHLFNAGAGATWVDVAATGLWFVPTGTVYKALAEMGTTVAAMIDMAATIRPNPPNDPITMHHIFGDLVSCQWNEWSNYGKRIDYCVDAWITDQNGKHSMDNFLR